MIVIVNINRAAMKHLAVSQDQIPWWRKLDVQAGSLE